jgi:ligand-binding sensor domain-containing protein
MKLLPFAVCLLLGVTINATWSTAQTKQLNFTNYSSRQGLSSVIVYDIMLDSYGFLWLATDDGLNRFDGTNFKIYRNDPSNRNGLGVNEITSLYESKDGTIWIGTNGGGLSFYDRNKDSIFNYRTIYPDPMSVAINSVSGDKNGNVWVTSFGATYVIDAAKKLAMSSQYDKLLKTVYGKVSMCFLQDTKRRIWLGTSTGLYLFDPAQNELKLFQHEETDTTSLPHNNINDLAEDQQGNIWVATENGLARVLPDGKRFMNIRRNSFPLKISSNNVYALAVAKDNRLWVGTDEGLDILDFGAKTTSTYIPDNRNPNSLASRSIRSLLIDPKGIYWVGTYRGGLGKYDENAHPFNLKEFNAFDPFGLGSPLVTSFAGYQGSVFIGTDGGGLQKYDRSTGLLRHINLPMANANGRHDLTILALETDQSKQLWIGTFSNGLYLYNPASGSNKIFNKGNLSSDLNNTDIFCLKADQKGNMWVGTNGGGINVIYAGSNQIDKYVNDPTKPGDLSRPSNNFIRCLEEDRNGRIWAGTFGGGVSVLDPASKQFRFYTRENSNLPSNYVFAIIQDSKGNIWAGTSGNGIGLLKPGSDKFKVFTEKDGLANGVINKVIEDAAGKIWISTNSGISSYDTITGKFTNYSTHDGLQSGSFIPGSGIGLADGVLFFGGQNGFNYFSPSLWNTNKNIPPVVLTDLKVDNQPVQPSSKAPIERSIVVAEQIRLQYKQTFSIAFEALNFTVPEANQYQYRMEGYDDDWINAGKEHRHTIPVCRQENIHFMCGPAITMASGIRKAVYTGNS